MELFTLATLILLCLFMLLFIFNYYLHHNRRGLLIDKIPGPKPLPLLGNMLDFNMPYEHWWYFARNSAKDYYPVYKLWFLHRPSVMIHHPDDIKILLSSKTMIKKASVYDFLRPWLATGLLTSTGDKWRRRRKIINSMFHFKILEGFMETFVEHTDKLVKTLLSEAQSGDVVKDLLPMFSIYSLGIVCDTAMGTRLNDEDNTLKEYRQALRDFINLFFWRTIKPWLKNDLIYSMTAQGRKQAKVLKIMHGFTKKIIEERKQYHDSTDGQDIEAFSAAGMEFNSETADLKNGRRLSFVDLLITIFRRDQGIDSNGIQEEVDTFIAASHHTTGQSLVFTALLLAEHRDIQARCREEVIEVMKGSVNGKLDMRNVQKLNYLDRCIKESLRLYPSVPCFSRRTTEDIQLKTCFIPEGSTINIETFDTHRDPHYWPRPNVFDPDRFLPENSAGRHPFAYIPFSAGTRNCIGKHFAMLELKTTLAGLLRNFYLEPMELAGSVRMVPDLSLNCIGEVLLKFIPIRNE
ncbi:cytochrome P450 4C1 isoform X1 [Diachasma alloeum]|uniref:cytochrome P450 4C1 isoform X1 n=1 Tax=Diachasma alloeum TaxID=454923 RepID=UPI0007384128|nr:cytochrome P450 4C1 isoform X1 [Diachasma alloeum]